MTDKERKRRYRKLWTYETADTKACSRCLKIKSIEEFSPLPSHRRGLQSGCKFCARKAARKKQCNEQTIKWLELRDQEEENEKVCKKCLVIKPLSMFHSSSNGWKNTVSYCKQCFRQIELKYKYKMAEGDYENLLRQQNNKCAICSSESSGRKDRIKFCVDHNHETDKIRALLCSKCNKGLGLFQDDPSLLRKAAEYLEIHNG